MLFSLWTCQGEAWQLNIQQWTNPCWSVYRALLCQTGPHPKGLVLSLKVLLCTDMLNKYTLVWAISIYPSPTSLIWSLHSSLPSSPAQSTAAVKWHTFIKCLRFQFLNSHVVLLLDNNLRPPPIAASHSKTYMQQWQPTLLLIWRRLN